jgi:toxin ParE1/3/4
LDEAVGFLAQDAPKAAVELLEHALDAAASLDAMSERGRVVPEVGRSEVRELFIGRYRLVYEVRAQEVFILAFLHGARDFSQRFPVQ